MENLNYRNKERREVEMEAKSDGLTWWPLFSLLGILGALLFWEAFSPLPLVPVQVVSFTALGLLFGGFAVWLMLFVKG